jgi:hypothetical protein
MAKIMLSHKSSFPIEEHKKLLEDDVEADESAFDEGGLITNDMLMDYDEEDDGEVPLEEYESMDHQINQNTILTPYKGSMLGGTILGEGDESAVAGIVE